MLWARMRRHTSSPSSPGSIQSRITRSAGSRCSVARASTPSTAVSTVIRRRQAAQQSPWQASVHPRPPKCASSCLRPCDVTMIRGRRTRSRSDREYIPTISRQQLGGVVNTVAGKSASASRPRMQRHHSCRDWSGLTQPHRDVRDSRLVWGYASATSTRHPDADHRTVPQDPLVYERQSFASARSRMNKLLTSQASHWLPDHPRSTVKRRCTSPLVSVQMTSTASDVPAPFALDYFSSAPPQRNACPPRACPAVP